jgi:hypothetical protein
MEMGGRAAHAKKAWTVLAGVILLAGCTHSSTSARDTPKQMPASPPASASGVTPAGNGTSTPESGKPAATLVSVARIPLSGQRDVESLRVFGGRVAWAACLPACALSDLPNTVFVADLATGHMRQIARSAFPHGDIEWVGGSGDYVAWTDKDREFSDDDSSSIWLLKVMDLDDGTVWTAASSGGVARIGAPLFRMSGSDLAWLAPTANLDSSDIRVVDLASHQVKTVLTGLQGGSMLGIDGSNIVYDANDAGVAPVDTQTRRDIFVLPITGGTPRMLSDQHDVTFPSAGEGWAAWGTPNNGDAAQVWAASIGGPPAARMVYDGGNVQRVVGQHFVALWTNGTTALLVVPLAKDGAPGNPLPVTGTPYIPAHFDAAGDQLAYATDTDPTSLSDVITLNVVKVNVS